MIRKSIYLIPIIFLCLLVACNSSINPEKLYGKWKYVKVANPNATPPDSVAADELAAQAPYIQFSKSNDLTIIWGGKILSHGKYSIEGYNIRYKESLDSGKTREFPFWVSKLTDSEIIFETKGTDGTRVNAVKQ